MVQKIGIDFGTTNSLISVITTKGLLKSYTENGKPHPSVLYFTKDDVYCGERAKKKLPDTRIGFHDYYFRAPKKFLDHDEYVIHGKHWRIEDVVAEYARFLKNHLLDNDTEGIADATTAVVTIPVALNGRGRAKLRAAFQAAGIQVHAFVHEPLAALYAYLRQQGPLEEVLLRENGKYVLVFDWGGGTLDLTLCKILNGTIHQVFNRGNNNVGGDFIDEAIAEHIIQKHAQQYQWDEAKLQSVVQAKRSELIRECERAKIDLSSFEKSAIFIDDYFEHSGDDSDIIFELTRSDLDAISMKYVEEGIGEIESLLGRDVANLDARQISFCLATGGMVAMPAIKHRLRDIFDVNLVIPKDADQIISQGAAWIAYDDPNISLAKPIELVEARNSLWTLLEAGTVLPHLNQILPTVTRTVYCADPTDGTANLLFKRPKEFGKSASTDPRVTSGSLLVPVNPDFPPLKERIRLNLAIDHNYVVQVTARAESTQRAVQTEIIDIEFAITAPNSHETEQALSQNGRRTAKYREKHEGIVVQSNVTGKDEDWAAVPGEVLYNHRNQVSYNKPPMSEEQWDEHVRYQPCSHCHSPWKIGCCTATQVV